MKPALIAIAAALALSAPAPALAWGYEGHEVIADIARDLLTPAVRAKVDALLATDFRSAGHRETAQWHFVDVELAKPDLTAACFGLPPAGGAASAGPAQDCVVDKVEEFERELADARTPAPERLLALKFLLHFVGDLHQPLHASDNQDRGGNCVRVALGGPRTTNLHSYWDTAVVQALGSDPQAVAASLEAQIIPADRKTWQAGDPRTWAKEAFGVAQNVAYTIGSQPGCNPDAALITLPNGYTQKAQAAAALQLKRAGVRLALELNRALG